MQRVKKIFLKIGEWSRSFFGWAKKEIRILWIFLKPRIVRLAGFFVWPIFLVYLFVFRPKTKGVKCLIVFQGKFLLIRNNYGPDHWNLPGGGVKKNELPEAAVRREIFEEVGIPLADVFRIGEYINSIYKNEDRVFCFSSIVSDQSFVIDPVEIREARWFGRAELPAHISSAVRRAIELNDVFEAQHTTVFKV